MYSTYSPVGYTDKNIPLSEYITNMQQIYYIIMDIYTVHIPLYCAIFLVYSIIFCVIPLWGSNPQPLESKSNALTH